MATGVRTVEILVDRTSIETFANDGETSLSACFLPTDDRLLVECSQGPVTVRFLKVFEIESIWKGTAATAADSSPNVARHLLPQREVLGGQVEPGYQKRSDEKKDRREDSR